MKTPFLHMLEMANTKLEHAFIELFQYAGDQITLHGLHGLKLRKKGQAVIEKQELQLLTDVHVFGRWSR